MIPSSHRAGATCHADGVTFRLPAPDATSVHLCLFDRQDRETARIAMTREADGWWQANVAGIGEGQRYGYRADGLFEPAANLLHDPAKLLADPWALRLDRPWHWHDDLATRAGLGRETANLVPKCVVERPAYSFAAIDAAGLSAQLANPCFTPGGLIYEVNVRGFSALHPDVPEEERGTILALKHPAIIAHLKKIGVSAVELMPVTAWIDERHLPPLGLTNSWGYNPVTFLALDPRLAPGGIADLKAVCDALRAEGISVFLDLVFNHTGESDNAGPTLSFRGLINRQAYLRDDLNEQVNVTGTGNTFACNEPLMGSMILDALRHFVLNGGVDGFRFDLAPVLGRGEQGFSPDAPLLAAMTADPVIGLRVLIAEPWDIGPGGYQLGNFPPPFLEWSDCYRDDVRRYWRGDAGMRGALATRLAGSSDIFARKGAGETRTVNFIAAHDGFTLADLVSYRHKHNELNGEANRDGHNENLSWNHGEEGATDNPEILEARQTDIKALLTTLFASRGTLMLTAGDEFGRTQHGNNNAYAQDNSLTWIDWVARNAALEDHVAMLAGLRARFAALRDTTFLDGSASADGFPDVEWRDADGTLMDEAHWQNGEAGHLAKLVGTEDAACPQLAFLFNPDKEMVFFRLPERQGHRWAGEGGGQGGIMSVAARSVGIALLENAADTNNGLQQPQERSKRNG